MRPKTWATGRKSSVEPPGFKNRSEAPCTTFPHSERKLPCVSDTPFGFPVVPLEYKIANSCSKSNLVKLSF